MINVVDKEVIGQGINSTCRNVSGAKEIVDHERRVVSAWACVFQYLGRVQIDAASQTVSNGIGISFWDDLNIDSVPKFNQI